MTNLNNPYLDLSAEVAKAKQEGTPIVALESTIISHGMPYPENLQTANEIENIIRSEGAVPATIAILHGRIKVGLETEELHYLATADNILKASRRDIPIAISQKRSAATTVAATMICAAMADVPVFATGGIGGVHRGAPESFDISADLQELAQTNVAVISAGVKSILDIGLTLEYLETMGVPVITVGSDQFPAFYTRESGLAAPYRMDTPAEIAAMLTAKFELGLKGGALVANPIPREASMDKAVIDKVILEALALAKEQNITGKDITPFLLGKIKDITTGDSLEANIHLVYNNARLAAKIAGEMGRQESKNKEQGTRNT